MKSIIFLISVLSACGTEKKDGGSDDGAPQDQQPPPAAAEQHHSLLVQDATALPACDATAEGWLVYLKAEAKFQACSSGAWADVAVTTTPATPTSVIAEEYVCDGTEDLNPDADVVEKALVAVVTKFTSGDYFISCQDHYHNSNFLDSDEGTFSQFFSKDSGGVTAGAVVCLGTHVHGGFVIAKAEMSWSRTGESDKATATCKKL